MTDADKTFEITRTVINALNNYLDKTFGHQKYVYSIQEGSKKGDNYMGVVYRITITSPNQNQKLILKVPPENPLRRQQFFARPGFLREALAYEEFLPLAYEFQKAKNIPISDMFHEYPNCKFTLTNDLHEAICMEDLVEAGFYMHDRFEPLTCEQVAIVMTVYGKLHATTLVMKDQSPEKLANLRSVVDIFVQRKDDPQLNEYFESLKKTALDSLDKTIENQYWRRINSYFNQGKFYDIMLRLLDSSSSEPYSVMCHGDCWINNIMFKSENNKICDVRLIDWQIMRYSSPIIDVMYFIMACTTKEFRDQHFNKMLNVYHRSATDHIKLLGANPEKLYPRTGFDRELKSKGAIGLLFSMIVLPISTTKSEDAPDLEKLSEKVSMGQSTDAMEAGFIGAKSTTFNKRMKGIICDSIDFGLLQ